LIKLPWGEIRGFDPLFGEMGLDGSNTAGKSLGSVATGALGINFSVSGQVDQGEKKVPKFPGEGGASTTGLAELF
jgi:hypothetical protein